MIFIAIVYQIIYQIVYIFIIISIYSGSVGMAADSEPEFNILSDILDTRDGNILVVVIVKSQRAKIKNQSQAKLAL